MMLISRRDFLISGAALVGSSCATAVTPRGSRSVAAELDRSGLEQLGTIAERAVSTGGTPGIALAVWKGGREIYSRYVGMANLEAGSRIAETSVFRIGSLTKQFAGALVLDLAAEGALSLSDPAHKHLPVLAKHEPFTIEELLHHTAGVRDGDYDVSKLRSHSQIEQANLIAQQEPFFDFRPGTSWLYSNANYILIGGDHREGDWKDACRVGEDTAVHATRPAPHRLRRRQ
jgi:D-alanyl-D-alanine carboxypeptidase